MDGWIAASSQVKRSSAGFDGLHRSIIDCLALRWLTDPVRPSRSHTHSARLGLKDYDAVLKEIKEGEATPTRTSCCLPLPSIPSPPPPPPCRHPRPTTTTTHPAANQPTGLQAVRLLALYEAKPEEHEAAVAQLRALLDAPATAACPTLQLVAALVYLKVGSLEGEDCTRAYLHGLTDCPTGGPRCC